MKILVVGLTSSPFEHEYKIHYSIFKTFYAATGFANLGHETYFLSKSLEKKIDNVQLISRAKVNSEFIQKLDLVIFTSELGAQKVFDACPGLRWLEKEKLAEKKGLPKIAIKMGKHTWLKNSRWGYKEGYKLFDFFFSQEKPFCDLFKKTIGDPNNKMFFSQMGVAENMPKPSKQPPFERAKYNLLYMGRLRQHPSRMPFLIDMMNTLGSDFKLILLPGTFSKPPGLVDRLNAKGENKFGAQVEENFQWLVNYFSKAPNIDVHRPVNWGPHWDYLYHVHLGLDFSPHWKGTKYPAGNAKLLEYMAAGLPSITEHSAGNSELVTIANGGIVLDKVGDLDSYCSAIKKALSMKFDRKQISNITIKNNSWTVRAQEMLKDMGY